MNYCHNCGKKIEGEIKFCSNCGTKISIEKNESTAHEDALINNEKSPLVINDFYPHSSNPDSILSLDSNLEYDEFGYLTSKSKPFIVNHYFKNLKSSRKLLRAGNTFLNISQSGFEIIEIHWYHGTRLKFVDYKHTSLVVNNSLFSIVDNLLNVKYTFVSTDINYLFNLKLLFSEELILTISQLGQDETNSDINGSYTKRFTDDKLELENRIRLPFIHYILIPINIIFPWSIVSWIGIPLSLYAKKQINKISETNKHEYKYEIIWTNISLGVFVFYLVLSILRALTIL